METSKKARAEVLLTAQEISLAKVLASNDKAIRDKGIKRLSKWITARSGSKLEFTEQDLMTIWKGLFYCMWMADKPLYQEELAERIANLIHSFKKLEQGLLYAECFLQTLRREWFGIDQHRLDKFMMLVRRCIRQLFVYCSSHSWPSETSEGISGLLERGITSSAELSPSLGLLFHVADVILEELAKVESPEKGLHAVILPFAALIACSKDGRVRQHVSERVFHHLIQQSPLGIEFQEKFEAWKQAGFPGSSWRDMVPVDVSDEDEVPGEEQGEKEAGEKHLDPRAGKVDIELPTIDFDAVEIAALLKSQMQKTANVKQRKALNVLVSQFITLSNGQYPLGFKKPPGSTGRRNRAEHQEELWQAAEDLVEFEEELLQKDPSDNGGDNSSSPQPGRKRKCQDADVETVQNKRKKCKLSSSEDTEKNVNLQKSSDDPKKSKKNPSNFSKGKKSSTPVVKEAREEEQQGSELTLEDNDDVTFHSIVAESKKSNRTVLCQKRNENEDVSSKVNANDTGVSLSDKLLKKKKKKRKMIAGEVIDTDSPIIQLTDVTSNATQSTRTKKSKQNSKTTTVTQNDENHFQQPNLKLVSSNLHALSNCTGEKKVLLAVRQSPETRGRKKLNGSIHGENMGLCLESTLQSVRSNVNVTRMAARRSLPLQQTSSPFVPKKRNSLSSWIVTDVSQPLCSDAARKENAESITCTATNSLPGTTPEVMKSPIKTPKKGRKAENAECGINSNGNSLLGTPPDSESSCAKTPKSAKKVNIVLQKNIAHEARDYHKVIRQSPSIPFDANKKPIQGVLKPGHLPSPVNPFYRKSQRLKL